MLLLTAPAAASQESDVREYLTIMRKRALDLVKSFYDRNCVEK